MASRPPQTPPPTGDEGEGMRDMGNELVIDEALASRVLEVVDAGLVSGIGSPIPGQMCVEAAVCYAMGLPHSDEPTCVGASVRRFKIRLNDSCWSSNEARAKGMRKLAIAQLGSDSIDQLAFSRIVVRETIKQIVPIALRAAAKRVPNHAENLESAAVRCEQEGSRAAAENARDVAWAAAAAADADAYAYAYAYAAADADADAGAAAYAAAAAAAYAAAYAARDGVLNKTAEIGLAALIELNSPGCAFLHLTEK